MIIQRWIKTGSRPDGRWIQFLILGSTSLDEASATAAALLLLLLLLLQFEEALLKNGLDQIYPILSLLLLFVWVEDDPSWDFITAVRKFDRCWRWEAGGGEWEAEGAREVSRKYKSVCSAGAVWAAALCSVVARRDGDGGDGGDVGGDDWNLETYSATALKPTL